MCANLDVWDWSEAMLGYELEDEEVLLELDTVEDLLEGSSTLSKPSARSGGRGRPACSSSSRVTSTSKVLPIYSQDSPTVIVYLA